MHKLRENTNMNKQHENKVNKLLMTRKHLQKLTKKGRKKEVATKISPIL